LVSVLLPTAKQYSSKSQEVWSSTHTATAALAVRAAAAASTAVVSWIRILIVPIPIEQDFYWIIAPEYHPLKAAAADDEEENEERRHPFFQRRPYNDFYDLWAYFCVLRRCIFIVL
jgi:hypothetical protein